MDGNIKELNSENFDKLTKKGNWVIDFWAAWCMPCRIMEPIFEAVAKEKKGKINFGKVDVDSEQELAERFQVMSVPTMIFLGNGEIVDNVIGTMQKEAFLKKINGNFK